MATPRKPRPLRINTPSFEGSGWVDKSVPPEIEAKFAGLPPSRRAPALAAIGEALGQFRAMSEPSEVSVAEARDDVASVKRVAIELSERLRRFPAVGEAEADAAMHGQQSPMFADLCASLFANLRALENVCDHVERRLGEIAKRSGRPRADRRRWLAGRLEEIATEAGLHRPAKFSEDAFTVLRLGKVPGPPKRKMSPPR